MSKNIWKYVALGAVAVSLIPFQIKREENGDFDYRSLLLGVSKKTNEETGDANLSLHFFNLPQFSRKDEIFEDDIVADGEDGVLIIEDVAAPAEAPEAPAAEEATEEAAAEEVEAAE